MKLPKVALISLRGVEGCGITSWVRQFYSYYKDVSEVCEFFALNDRVGRPDTSSDVKVRIFGSSDFEEVSEVINRDFDLAMIVGVPSRKSKHADTYVPLFLNRITIRKVMINHDHHSQSIVRNAHFKEAIEACDVVCAHSLEPAKKGFISWMKRHNVVANNIVKLYTFIHPSRYESLITTSVENRQKKITNVGRAVLWKRNLSLFNIAKRLAEHKFIVELLGFERSIAGWSQIDVYKDQLDVFNTKAVEEICKTKSFFKHFDTMSPFQKTEHNNLLIKFIEEEMPYQPYEYTYCLGSINHNIAMERLSRSAFGSHLRSFEFISLCYGNNHEYQGLESMLLSIPIFHRHFLETCTLPGTDIKLNTLDCFMSLDDDNRHIKAGGPQVLEPEVFIDKLEAVWSNPNLYQQMRTQNIEIVQKYYSCEALVPNFVQTLI